MENIAVILKRIFKRPRLQSGVKKWKTRLLWEEAVGAEIAAHSDVVGFKNGRMTVIVPSGPWAQELTVNRDEIMTILNELARCAGGEMVKELVFKVGRVRTSCPDDDNHGPVETTGGDFSENPVVAAPLCDLNLDEIDNIEDNNSIVEYLRRIAAHEIEKREIIRTAGGRQCAACGVWYSGKDGVCLYCQLVDKVNQT